MALKSRLQDTQNPFKILQILGGNPRGLNISEIAEATGITFKTVHDIVKDLSADGFVTTEMVKGEGRGYQKIVKLTESGKLLLEAYTCFMQALDKRFDALLKLRGSASRARRGL